MKKIIYMTIAIFATLFSLGPAFSQSAPKHYLSTASTNCNLVQSGKVIMHDGIVVNTTAAIYYLKLFNKATAPVAGTDTPVMTIPIPFGASSAGGGAVIPSTLGYLFGLGFGFCLTGAIADNDNTNAATGVAINFGISTN